MRMLSVVRFFCDQRAILAGGAVVVIGSACASGTSSPTSPARSELQPITVTGTFSASGTNSLITVPNAGFRYAVTILNKGASAAQVSYGGCWGFVQLFKSADRTGTPAFDFANLRPDCTANLTMVTLQPGQTTDLAGSMGFGVIQGAGVPVGHYYVSVRIAPNGDEVSVPAGEVDVTGQ